MEPFVQSEVGRLRRVVVHAPDRELLNVSSANHREFLFSDLLYPRYACREHGQLVNLLRDVFGVEVLYFRELLQEALVRADAPERLELIEEIVRLERLGPRDAERLLPLATRGCEETLAERTIAGEPVGPEESLLEHFLTDSRYHLAPIPNLMLVRDVAAVLHNEMFAAWSSRAVRQRENLLWRFILRHSHLEGMVRWHDWAPDVISDPVEYALEGGNVMQLAPNVAIVARSMRTGTGAVERLTAWLAGHVEQEFHLFVAVLPPPYEHLDTIFTMLSRDECLVFPPSVFGNGPESVDVLQVTLRPGSECACVRPRSFLEALGRALGTEITPVKVGGETALHQKREQWWGGASALAVEPGRVIAFRSAERTAQELAARGYVSLEAEDVLEGRSDPGAYEKVAVLLRGSELSRARGGPHSLVLPLVRDTV